MTDRGKGGKRVEESKTRRGDNKQVEAMLRAGLVRDVTGLLRG